MKSSDQPESCGEAPAAGTDKKEVDKKEDMQPQGCREVGDLRGRSPPATGTGRRRAAALIFDGILHSIPADPDIRTLNVIGTR